MTTFPTEFLRVLHNGFRPIVWYANGRWHNGHSLKTHLLRRRWKGFSTGRHDLAAAPQLRIYQRVSLSVWGGSLGLAATGRTIWCPAERCRRRPRIISVHSPCAPEDTTWSDFTKHGGTASVDECVRLLAFLSAYFAR